MKRLRFLVCFLSLLLASHASGDGLRVSDVRLRAGDTCRVAVLLDNPDASYVAFQFNLELPDGFTLEMEDGTVQARLNADRISDHSLSVSASGRFLSFSMSNAAFKGTSGDLVYFVIRAADDLPAGQQSATICSQLFTEADGTEHEWADVAFSIIPVVEQATLSLPDVELSQGATGQAGIMLEDPFHSIAAFQFDLMLPEGVSIARQDDQLQASLNAQCIKDHLLNVSEIAGGYRFLSFSMSNAPFSVETDTPLVFITLQAADTTPEGVYEGSIVGQCLTNQDGGDTAPADIPFFVNIEEDAGAQFSLSLTEGWNWVSVNLDLDAMRSARSFISPFEGCVIRMQSQTQELVNDEVYGIVGNLETLSPTAGYRLQLREAVSRQWRGPGFAPADTPVQLSTGWNWLGYVPQAPLPVETALEHLDATAGDRIVSQNGFAEYDGSAWLSDNEEGFLMQPGEGYLYWAKCAKTFVYSASPGPHLGERRLPPVGIPSPMGEAVTCARWKTNVHQYPDVTTIIATICPDTSAPLTLGAFCGDECRGVGRWVDGRLFITVHGTCGLDETITFRVFDGETARVLPVSETIVFRGQCLGALGSPMQLHLAADATGNGSSVVLPQGSCDVYSVDGRLVKRGSDSLAPALPAGVYVIGGKKLVVH